MAQLITIEDNRNGYRRLVDEVISKGRHQASRNGDTLEIDDLVIELLDPTKSIPCGIGREGYSHALAYLEGLQLVAAQTYDDLMVKVAPNTARFREDDQKFHGAYGRRLEGQLETIADRLKADPDTRQAIVNIWDYEKDAAGGKRDHPCTIALGWRVRDGKLLATTFMRSQDVHWGWPYDVVMFTMLQLTLANYLGVEPGSYTHHAVSFHAYTKDIDALGKLTPHDRWTDTRVEGLRANHCETWSQVQARARELVRIAADQHRPPMFGMSDVECEYHYAIRKKVL